MSLTITQNHVTFGHSNKPLHPAGVLIHGIYNKLDDAKRFDAKSIIDILQQYNVAAHYLVTRSGAIFELVPPTIQCWHAGKSWFKGISGLNSSFIGIEFVGDETTPYEEVQYTIGGELLAYLVNQYNISTDMITTHQIVSGPKVRPDYKWDPGPMFDMIKLGQKMLEA